MNLDVYDYINIEKKWQKEWFNNKIYESNISNKNKFFIHFAYPGVSGYLHIGHMRGFTYCDIFARYKRMMGYNVLFPAGFHRVHNAHRRKPGVLSSNRRQEAVRRPRIGMPLPQGTIQNNRRFVFSR